MTFSLVHIIKSPQVLRVLCFIAIVVFQNEGQQALGLQGSDTQATKPIDFVTDVQPILRTHCYECHAGTTEEGGLNLGIKERAMTGGDSGESIVPGHSDDSLLVQLVSGKEEGRIMPPEGKPSLSELEIDTIRNWIQDGATWPAEADVIDPKLDRAKQHWAFQRLKLPEVPEASGILASQNDWPKTDIDRYVMAGLDQAGLRPAQPADSRTLVRRLYFDLIGLPPTPQQIDAFVQAHEADADQAMAALVDELLESPHFGERWGRHWLDVARYADSDGQEADHDRPYAYRYRDFVIQAFNDNMPYNQFIQWQIAGDEFQPDSDQAVAATGFLIAGTYFKLPDSFLERERLLNRYNELDDVISTLGSGMLGLTVACARCHDHKYDAFSAKEYYQLLGVFHSGDRTTAKLPSGEEGYFFRDFDDQRRTTWLFRRSDFYDREIEVPIGFPVMLSNEVDAADYWARAKDDYKKLGHPKSTLQRRALADWMTDTENGGGALLARVMVNRVWHHHFGTGLVETTGDFGVQGDRPSNPELLEYLAAQFVAEGWDLKALHRKILCSAVWQQASIKNACDPNGLKVDPANRLLWRMKPKRLEAEILRDAMLAVSDKLNLAAGGPGFKPYIAPEANQARNIQGEGYPKDAKDDANNRRRSVYMFHKRLIPYPMFQAFDRPDLMTSCSRRQNTTVAPQAMVILNDRFVRAVAQDFAQRLIQQFGESGVPEQAGLEPVIQQAFVLSFARLPSESELTKSIQFVESQAATRAERNEKECRLQALTDYCQTLFGLNEFIYVD